MHSSNFYRNTLIHLFVFLVLDSRRTFFFRKRLGRVHACARGRLPVVFAPAKQQIPVVFAAAPGRHGEMGFDVECTRNSLALPPYNSRCGRALKLSFLKLKSTAFFFSGRGAPFCMSVAAYDAPLRVFFNFFRCRRPDESNCVVTAWRGWQRKDEEIFRVAPLR
jgi:hypothetical protein